MQDFYSYFKAKSNKLFINLTKFLKNYNSLQKPNSIIVFKSYNKDFKYDKSSITELYNIFSIYSLSTIYSFLLLSVTY